jgi:hypothetical protein
MTDVTLRADLKQVAGARLPIANLLGVLVNVKKRTDHITSIEVSERTVSW